MEIFFTSVVGHGWNISSKKMSYLKIYSKSGGHAPISAVHVILDNIASSFIHVILDNIASSFIHVILDNIASSFKVILCNW